MVDVDKFLKKTFKNPFLESVYFQLRYPAMISILERIDEFQNKITNDLPNFSEETIYNMPSDRKNFNSYVFSNIEKDFRIKVSLNSITLIWENYKSFPEALEDISKYGEIFLEVYGIEMILRVGLAYASTFTLVVGQGSNLCTEFSRYFNPMVQERLLHEGEKLSSFNVDFRKEVEEEFFISMKAVLAKKTNSEQYKYTMNFDAYTQKNTPAHEYIQLAKKLKNIEKAAFLESIKSEYLTKAEEVLKKHDQ